MIAILADDLTGAAEVAGVCLRYGLKVALGLNELPTEVKTSGLYAADGSQLPSFDACVIATDSRSMTREEAFETHHRLAESLKKAGINTVYKKTDSVLRGHVLAELEALMDVFSCRKVILQPANPSLQRCIINGQYLVSGKPLHQSSFADDPDYPATTSSVVELLKSRDGTNDVLTVKAKAKSFDTDGVHVPDCQSVQELKKGLISYYKNVIHAGSAAFLAAFLEECAGLSVQQVAFKLDPMRGRYLLICGSLHAQSQVFIESAKRKGTAVAEFSDDFLKETINTEALENWADSLAEFWHQTGQMVISLSHKPVLFKNSSAILTARLALVVHRILDQCRMQEILVLGGATAWAILQDQGWNKLTPVEELAPGVVRMHLDKRPGLYLTLKPGSYLWPEELDN